MTSATIASTAAAAAGPTTAAARPKPRWRTVRHSLVLAKRRLLNTRRRPRHYVLLFAITLGWCSSCR